MTRLTRNIVSITSCDFTSCDFTSCDFTSCDLVDHVLSQGWLRPEPRCVICVICGLHCQDRDVAFIRHSDHLLAIEDEGFFRREAEAGGTGVDHCFDRRYADDRNIETHVLIRLG